MLDKKCKKIIKCCNKNFNDDRMIDTEKLQRYIPLSKLDIYYCCTELNKLGFFEIFQTSIEKTVHFIPDYKLYNYKEHSRTELKSFIIKSILIPIGVSIATSILTCLLVQTLIPMIISLLTSGAS